MREGKLRIVQSGENYINNHRVSQLHNSYPDGATLTDTAIAVVKNLLLCYTNENRLILKSLPCVVFCIALMDMFSMNIAGSRYYLARKENSYDRPAQR